MVSMRNATSSDIPAIKALLNSAKLHTEGVGEGEAEFWVAEELGVVVGVIGLEVPVAGVGLLRSFSVQTDHRHHGIGRQLFEHLYSHVRHLGVSTLFLLTNDVQGYFEKLGFLPINRDQVPQAIRSTQQFSELCPESVIIMQLEI